MPRAAGPFSRKTRAKHGGRALFWKKTTRWQPTRRPIPGKWLNCAARGAKFPGKRRWCSCTGRDFQENGRCAAASAVLSRKHEVMQLHRRRFPGKSDRSSCISAAIPENAAEAAALAVISRKTRRLKADLLLLRARFLRSLAPSCCKSRTRSSRGSAETPCRADCCVARCCRRPDLRPKAKPRHW